MQLKNIWGYYQEGGLNLVWARLLEKTLLNGKQTYNTRLRIYLAIAQYCYRNTPAGLDEFDSPPDPYKIEWVHPDKIRSFSKREYPPWSGLDRNFGTVMGNWEDFEPDEQASMEDVYQAPTFKESIIYQ